MWSPSVFISKAFQGPHSLLPMAVEGHPWVTPTLREGWTPTSVSSPPRQPLSGAEGLGAALAAATRGHLSSRSGYGRGRVRLQGRTLATNGRRESPVLPTTDINK